MSRIGILVALGAAFLAAYAAWATWGSTPVTVTPVVRGDAAEVVYATGAVEPVRWAKVVPLQRRRLIDICGCEGDAVQAGTILARQDDAEERAVLAEIEARYERLEADRRRLAGLLERNAASLTAVEQAASAAVEAQARIAAARERVDALRLRAPIDGVILRQDFFTGEIVGPGDVVFWVGPPKPLRVVAEVNEEDMGRIATGMRVLLRNDAFHGRVLQGVLRTITPKGDPVSKTFRVHIELPDDTPLLIGMSVEANIVSREAAGVPLLPVDAVVDGKVFVLREGRAVAVPVRTGIRGTRMIELVEGPREGEPVIVPVPPGLTSGRRARIETGP